MTQCFCITSKSVEHLFFAALQGKKWAHQYIHFGKKPELCRLTTAVVSFDLLQFQMADLIPGITLGMEMLTGPSLRGHETIIINSEVRETLLIQLKTLNHWKSFTNHFAFACRGGKIEKDRTFCFSFCGAIMINGFPPETQHYNSLP